MGTRSNVLKWYYYPLFQYWTYSCNNFYKTEKKLRYLFLDTTAGITPPPPPTAKFWEGPVYHNT